MNRNDEELYKWWHHCVHNPPEDFTRLGIATNKKLIGYTDIACIEECSAELGIAIGERSLWGKGIGYTAACLTIEYAANNFGITTFHAETHEKNVRSRKMLEKVGFKEVSRVGFEEYLGTNERLIQYRLIL